MTNALALTGAIDWNEELTTLAKQTVCKGASDAEFKLFIEQCKATKLNPFARQIYSIRRKQWNGDTRSYDEAQVTQVSIDGFRLIADRTAKYAGQVGPWWCGTDGEWREVWLVDEPPAAAKVGVLRHDFNQPIYSIALYKSYVSTNAKGDPVSRWKTDPAGMLAKCAESLALRRAFPQELSGLYTSEEMAQADNPADVITVPFTPAPEPPKNGKAQQPAMNLPPQPEQPVIPGAKAADGAPVRPYTPDVLRVKYAEAVEKIEKRGLALGPDDFAITASTLMNLGDPEQVEKYLKAITGIEMLEDMNESQVIALLRLLGPKMENSSFYASEIAEAEFKAVVA